MMYKAALCALAVFLAGTIGLSDLTSTSTLPKVVAKVAITGRTTAIPTTNLVTPTANGLYRVSAYGVVTSPNGNTGFWVLNLNWKDNYGSETCYNGTPQGTTCSLLSINSNWENYGEYRWAQNGWVIRDNAGAPISFLVIDQGGAAGSTYDLFVTVEQLE
jgi:hypothetical protein